MTKKPVRRFSFEISLSVLNHLGRNLYRNFATVLGEAISNAWDADASNVWIYIAKDKSEFVIKDDGHGMNADDFQDKFLKIGYSKRKDGKTTSANGRPFIGAKGIGKLALLSCAKKISVISKPLGGGYVGGVIDNKGLDEAIEHDMTPDKYPLGEVVLRQFSAYTQEHEKGTIVYFEETKENIKSTVQYLRKIIALYFRFSLIDKSFNIFVNGDPVTLADIKTLSESTEFLWKINDLQDPYLDTLSALKNEPKSINSDLKIKGFIATVVKPKDLKITGTEEKAGVDLFVNGRLREKDLLKHIPTARIAESYIYGQIHFDALDGDGEDRFTSSREGVLASDEKYQELLKELKDKIVPQVLTEWDELRLSRDEDGDDEDARKTPKERRALSLYNLTSKDYTDKTSGDIKNWVKELQPDAAFNIPSYVDCFLSENLIRRYIQDGKLPLTQRAINEVRDKKTEEVKHKKNANVSFDINRLGDLSYLGMDTLSDMVDGPIKLNAASLSRDANEYKPMRNAVAHTALLTDVAKQRLRLVYENIKGRLAALLSATGS